MGKAFKDQTAHLITSLLIDLVAAGVVFFMPDIVKTLRFPVYLIDPMRVLTLIALAHSGRINALFLAVALPAFSYFTGGHPHLLKSGLIATELIANILLFFVLARAIPTFASMLLAILLSKGLYYGLKWTVIQTGWIDPPLLATPLWIQGIVALVMSGYVYLYFQKGKKGKV